MKIRYLLMTCLLSLATGSAYAAVGDNTLMQSQCKDNFDGGPQKAYCNVAFAVQNQAVTGVNGTTVALDNPSLIYQLSQYPDGTFELVIGSTAENTTGISLEPLKDEKLVNAMHQICLKARGDVADFEANICGTACFGGGTGNLATNTSSTSGGTTGHLLVVIGCY